MASNAQTVAIEADGESVLSLLYVQNATGGTLTESTLTLIGVSERTAVFSDRPHRFASRIPTEDFISRWDEGEDSFAENSPNADFTCESGGEVVNYAVELSDPSFDGQNLSYAVDAVGASVLPEALQCDSVADLFIDDEGGNTDGLLNGYGHPFVCLPGDQVVVGITIPNSSIPGTPCYCPNLDPLDGDSGFNPNNAPECKDRAFAECCIP